MRKIAIVGLGLAALVAFTGCGGTATTNTPAPAAAPTVSIAPTNLQPGMFVAGAFLTGNDLSFYTLGATEDNGETYAAKMFSGADDTLDKANILYVFPAKLDVKVGDAVVAPNTFFNGTLLRGTVKEVKTSSYVITWDPSKPGLEDEEVPAGRLLPGNLVTYKCGTEPCML